MPKYYVKSGELEEIVVAPTPMIAAFEGFCRMKKDIILDPNYFYVDERGFRDGTNCDKDCVEIENEDLLDGYFYE